MKITCLAALWFLCLWGVAYALPATPPYNNFGADFLGNPNAASFSSVGTQMNFITLRLLANNIWTACNGNSGDYSFTGGSAVFDAAVTSAVTTNSKSIVIDIELGPFIPDCELTRLGALSPSGTMSSLWRFATQLVQQTLTIVPGDAYVLPIPWNATYRADVKRLLDAVATRVYTTLAIPQADVVAIVDTINGENDDESALPSQNGTGLITCAGGGSTVGAGLQPTNAQCQAVPGASCTGGGGTPPCTVSQPNDVATWIAQTPPYTPSLPASAAKDISDYMHTDFPNAVIHHMILRSRFPGISSSSVATGAADLLITPQLIMQTVGPSLPPGYCEVQVNNMGYSNSTGSPNMADAANTAAGSGCWVGFQSNGSSANVTDANFASASSQSIRYNPGFEEWYQTEWNNEVAANPALLTWLVNQLANASSRGYNP